MALRPRDQDKIDVRLTGEAEYLIPFTFIEALNEGTLFDRPEHAKHENVYCLYRIGFSRRVY